MSETNIDLFFRDPTKPEEVLEVEEFGKDEKLCHLMYRTGLFPSVTQAKKNGWDKPVPPGFSHFVVGKKKMSIWILNSFEGMD